MMRVVVTGGAGFIGSALCRRLVAQSGWVVLNLDALTYAASPAALAEIAQNPNYHFVEGDICDRALLDRIFAEFRPGAVVHLAAESHVDRSITGSDAFIRTNIGGTHTLLEAALAYWEGLPAAAKAAFRFLHVSTDEVFGALGEAGAFDESSRYDPRSPYAATKAAADHLVRAWAHTYGLPALIANSTNNYGPYQFPEKLIPLAVLNALEGKPVEIYGDGRQIRDWLHVEDHAAALQLILERGRVGESYMVGARSERANLDVVRAICDHVDARVPPNGEPRRSLIAHVEDRPGHDRRYAADCAKLERELGWAPTRDFETGLAETVAWYLARRDWWAPIRERIYAGARQGLKAAR